MEYITLLGAKVPVLGFGTAGIKGKQGKKAMKNALNSGYRLIDTAQSYNNEDIVGSAVSEVNVDREDLFITTKIRGRNLSYDDVIDSFDESLRKLKMDYVDLLLIHWPNENVPLKETLNAMNKLKEEGRIKHIGVSNFTVPLMDKARKVSKASILCNQVEYHPFLSQEKILTYCQMHSLLLTAYSPLARGKVGANETLKKLGKKYGKTPFQVTLRWHIQQENVMAIPRSSSPRHQEENIDVFDFSLSSEDMQTISNLERGERLIDPKSAPWR
ncbi:MAG: aldo/keto reductase [Candidatus Korarchaeota archaeon]|nr:aldo/keto reductase [Candidatus Korarchaeota archaeon]NIU84098.1 aldo/keto reductase [Candidatus Thorarchaeota archaeon]NIW14242.1 aldo/keto reductase [Candidatus Thorarchaeota archaeon]NIW52334.1 aldo/keto reductase [Candidatus Korarchaeota archaeon]